MYSGAVPTFYLYGESPRAVDRSFVHVEQLDDRSRPSDWTIQPHSHSDLHQIFVAETGGGTVSVDGKPHAIPAPALMLVPCSAVHGFDWERNSTGWVLTFSRMFSDALVARHPELDPLFGAFRLQTLTQERHEHAVALARDLRRELGWSVPCHDVAVEAIVLRFLVLCRRILLHTNGENSPRAPSPAAALVARFRERVEARFASREKIAGYADALGCSESSLRNACALIANRSPSRILDDRSLLEAKRLLLYSNLSIAQIAYALGFADPAYFSRFFKRETAASPSEFRQGSGSASP